MKNKKQFPIKNQKSDKYGLRLLVGIAFTLSLPQVNAAEFVKTIIVGTGVAYDSNPAMTSGKKEPVWIYTITPEFLLDINDEINHGYLDAALTVERHSNENVLINREDPNVAAGWDRIYGSGSYGIKADYIESSARAEQLRSTGVFTGIDNTQKTKEISAYWKHAINSRWSVHTQGAYHDISFTLPGDVGGFDLGEIGSKLSFANSEKLNTYAQLAYSHFRTDQVFDNTNLVRLDMGADYKINEKFTIAAHAGPDNLSGGQSGTDWEAGIQADYVAERMNYIASLSRGFSPSSAGGFQMANTLHLGWLFGISEQDKIGADYTLNKYRRDAEINLSAIDTQTLGVFYTKKLSSHWEASVSASHKELHNSTATSTGNLIGATLVFNTLGF